MEGRKGNLRRVFWVGKSWHCDQRWTCTGQTGITGLGKWIG